MRIRKASVLLSAVILGLVLILVADHAQAGPANDDRSAICKALTAANFSRVADAPTQISEAKVLERTWVGKVGPFCRVTGYVHPNVGFVLLLPAHWNGKFLHVGCAGWCGSAEFAASVCALHSEYACIGSDMGHAGTGGLWIRDNLQGQVDFAYRATHVVTLAGKAIVERYYGKTPKESYFFGYSTGGYQAMVEAQRFPWDFNGIIAGAPDMDESDLAVRRLWIRRNLLGADGQPVLDSAAIELVHQAALDSCDMDDGVKDGLIGDPVHCKFDPTRLQCKAGQTNACLTPHQVQAVKNIYGTPMSSTGQLVPTSGAVKGLLPGSELNWASDMEAGWDEHFFQATGLLDVGGKEWTYLDFDFRRDYPRTRNGAGSMFDDTNPDLRKFKAAGGKLLIYQGANDTQEIPPAVVDYYEAVERVMGGRAATQEFSKLFMVPGMDHCTAGAGAYAIDYLSYLDAWVEKGKAPDAMIGAHVADGYLAKGPIPAVLPPELAGYSTPEMRPFVAALYLKFPLDPKIPIAFTRPVYPYPLYAKYRGVGDPHDAASFGPAEP